ncbi:MAG TPA: AarF/ABC1/UbiB kinase family protein [Actinomycetota bacterium]|jgi:predicted unusual protein kinase regulating ubiquinone biosynthesis (AarF/ABC1/UbiB family)|nr:AarF/ABC1/UbiB kinase family protein [Actinomycetota bacterium]
MEEKDRGGAIPTGWFQRGARLAGQTGKSAARFLGTRARSFAHPDRANEYLDVFHRQTAQQLVQMLGEMKGAAMKLGQLASFYEFAADNEHVATYRDALTMLQNSAPPMDPEASKQVIREEFGAPVDEVFAEFDDEPVASASIGQVHRAVLPTGEEVAVKVQYPGVDEAVRADLKNVTAMTKIAVAIAPNLDPREIAAEVKERVLEELDYRREAANQHHFRQLYDDHPFIVVPRVYTDYCRPRVITQEFIHGKPFMTSMTWPQERKDELAEMLFRFFYGSFHRFLLFSADPHPGNYLLLDDDRVAFLDYGLMRAVDPGTYKLLLETILALIDDDRSRCREALEGLGILNARTPDIDQIWHHLKFINRPVLEDKPVTVDPDLASSIGAAGFDPRSEAFQALRKLGVPPLMVTFNRMSFGVGSVMARLEATRNWQRISREMWFGEPSETRLGRAEQEWLAKAHPDHRPPLGSD